MIGVKNKINLQVIDGDTVKYESDFCNTLFKYGSVIIDRSFLGYMSFMEGVASGGVVRNSTYSNAITMMPGAPRLSSNTAAIDGESSALTGTLFNPSYCNKRQLLDIGSGIIKHIDTWVWLPGVVTGTVGSIGRYYTPSPTAGNIKTSGLGVQQWLSGSLLKDNEGNPITLTPAPTDRVVITYTFEFDFSSFLLPASVYNTTIAGVETEVKIFTNRLTKTILSDGKTIQMRNGSDDPDNSSPDWRGDVGTTFGTMRINESTIFPNGSCRHRFRTFYEGSGDANYYRGYLQQRGYVQPDVVLENVSTLELGEFIYNPGGGNRSYGYQMRVEFNPPIDKPRGMSLTFKTDIWSQNPDIFE